MSNCFHIKFLNSLPSLPKNSTNLRLAHWPLAHLLPNYQFTASRDYDKRVTFVAHCQMLQLIFCDNFWKRGKYGNIFPHKIQCPKCLYILLRNEFEGENSHRTQRISLELTPKKSLSNISIFQLKRHHQKGKQQYRVWAMVAIRLWSFVNTCTRASKLYAQSKWLWPHLPYR